MFLSLFISYKETLEAALILCSTVIYLNKFGKYNKVLYIYLGSALGLIFSMFIVFFCFETIQSIMGSIENIIDEAALLLILFFIIFFAIAVKKESNLSNNFIARNIKYIESLSGLFLIGFYIEFKEGIELIILNFTSLNKSPFNVLAGTIVGMILAILSVCAFRKSRYFS